MTRRTLLVPALLIALSGCSGGGDTDEGPSAEQVKKAYVEQASAVCTKADADFTALPQPATPEAFAPYVEKTVGIAATAQAELSALTPPEPDRAELESRVLSPFAALVADGRAYAQKVRAAGTDQAKLLPLLSQRPTPAGIDLEHLRSYGLGVCADAIAKAGS